MHDADTKHPAHNPQANPLAHSAEGANETAPTLRSVMHGDPYSLTPGELAERRTMRYVETADKDHTMTEWGGVVPLMRRELMNCDGDDCCICVRCRIAGEDY